MGYVLPVVFYVLMMINLYVLFVLMGILRKMTYVLNVFIHAKLVMDQRIIVQVVVRQITEFL